MFYTLLQLYLSLRFISTVACPVWSVHIPGDLLPAHLELTWNPLVFGASSRGCVSALHFKQ